MNGSSLRLRLLLVWAVFIAVTLQIAAVGLRVMFERSIARRTQAELEADVRQLRRGMEVSGNGEIRIAREPTDPQFYISFGGRYWQIDENGQPILRSRSLENATLTASPRAASATGGTTWLLGPERERLFAIMHEHIVPSQDGRPERRLTMTAAVDAAEIDEDTNKFSADLFRSLLGLAMLLMLGAWAHVSIGLSPLKALSSKVAAVRNGKAMRISGEFPEEVLGLVLETNGLLDGQEEALKEARARAGDLAHGLKTPLAVMGANARTLRRLGIGDVADEIDRQVDHMRRHVDRELARARAGAAVRMRHAPVDIAKLVFDLAVVIEGLPRERDIAWTLDVPPSMLLRVDAEDFNNMAGNVLENAGKWASGRIQVVLKEAGDELHLVVDDDGPGIPEDQFERVLRRGERADTSVAGSGLGLAIVNDLVVLYRGRLVLARSHLGGLSASVVLPRVG